MFAPVRVLGVRERRFVFVAVGTILGVVSSGIIGSPLGFPRASVSRLSRSASSRDIFSSALSFLRSSRLRPSSGMSSAAPATQKTRLLCPNRI